MAGIFAGEEPDGPGYALRARSYPKFPARSARHGPCGSTEQEAGRRLPPDPAWRAAAAYLLTAALALSAASLVASAASLVASAAAPTAAPAFLAASSAFCAASLAT